MKDQDRNHTSLYARVSSEHQVVLETYAGRLDLLNRRILADGRFVAPELRFIDDGYSGETLRRPGLERLPDTALPEQSICFTSSPPTASHMIILIRWS